MIEGLFLVVRAAGNQLIGLIVLTAVLPYLASLFLAKDLPERVILAAGGVQPTPYSWTDERRTTRLIIVSGARTGPMAFSNKVLASVRASDACSAEIVHGGEFPTERCAALSSACAIEDRPRVWGWKLAPSVPPESRAVPKGSMC